MKMTEVGQDGYVQPNFMTRSWEHRDFANIDKSSDSVGERWLHMMHKFLA